MRFLRGIGTTLLSWGPWGILLLAVLDSAGIPVPEGVDALIVIIAAQNATTGYFSAALAVIGSLVGCLFLFYLGRKGGEAYLDTKTRKGWPLRFRRWFHHYGGLTVFIPTLIPIPLPLKIFVLSAGALRMNRAHFVLIVLAARIPRYFGLAYFGAQMGTYPLQYLKKHAWQLVIAAFVLFLLLLAAVKIKDRLRIAAERRLHHHHHHH